MTFNVYVIKDTRLNRYNMPFYARNDDEAKVILLRSGIPKSIYEDTKLFRVGSFCDDAFGLPLVSNEEVEVQMLPYPNKEGVTM